MSNPIYNETTHLPAECSKWAHVEILLSELVVHFSQLAPNTIANARRLATVSSGRFLAPSEIDLGYRPTVRLIWSSVTPPIEIEIFDDHYEVYRFFEGATDIQHFAVTADIFPATLELVLDELIPEIRT